jgi:pimeloyl-ACP methyl ester carboxylesterase
MARFGRVPADYVEPVFGERPGWRRIYLDLPGRGATTGEPWITTNDQVLDIVLRVIDQVVLSERFVLAGHAAGAHLARAVLRSRFGLVDGLSKSFPISPWAAVGTGTAFPGLVAEWLSRVEEANAVA